MSILSREGNNTASQSENYPILYESNSSPPTEEIRRALILKIKKEGDGKNG
jgi:hypothetical protein